MLKFNGLGRAICVAMACVSLASASWAGVIATGDVDPADPTAWTGSTEAYVGKTGEGTVAVDSGSGIQSDYAYIGYLSGSTGTVTVDGPGSTWTNQGHLYVGGAGNGTLNITNGGVVDAGENVILAVLYASGIGEIHFDNGTLNAGGLWAGPTQLTGTGTINTSGLVSDVDLVFDSPQSLKRTILFDGEPGQNITVNLDLSGGDGALGVGMHCSGALIIRDGVSIACEDGCIGEGPGSTGTVTVDGADSTWTNDRVRVGRDGNGTLNITNGGAVSSNRAWIGYGSGSTGTATVDGTGSTWSNSGGLYVGREGNGTLNITNGGAVSSNRAGWIGYGSGSTGTATVDGTGSTWSNSGGLYVGREGNGTLNITNGGLVSVGDTLTIDYDGGADSFINMASGGMLALLGQADNSLADLLDLIEGTDAIRYWNGSGWSPITNGVRDVDYTLGYIQDGGDLDGYTMLTVPEPASMALLALGGLALVTRRRGLRG